MIIQMVGSSQIKLLMNDLYNKEIDLKSFQNSNVNDIWQTIQKMRDRLNQQLLGNNAETNVFQAVNKAKEYIYEIIQQNGL